MEEVSKIIRKPIHKELCNCWGQSSVYINGEPQWFVADTMTVSQLSNFLQDNTVSMGFLVNIDTNDSLEKIKMCLKNNLPVSIVTRGEVPQHVLEGMLQVPHSAIRLSIELPRDSSEDCIEGFLSKNKDLRKMMILAKSWKISTALDVEYSFSQMKKLDLYELIEFFRICTGIVSVNLTEMVTDLCYAKLSSDIKAYMKGRKIPIELVRDRKPMIQGVNRIASSSDKYPAGIPSGIYSVGSSFKYDWKVDNRIICNKCGREIIHTGCIELNNEHK